MGVTEACHVYPKVESNNYTNKLDFFIEHMMVSSNAKCYLQRRQYFSVTCTVNCLQ